MRRSKYQSLGIMDFLEKLTSGGTPKFNRGYLYENVKRALLLKRPAYSKKVYSLKQHGFIKYLNSREFTLTKKGLRRIDFLRFEKLTLPDKKRDSLWRLIVFDIPERRKTARRLFRDKLLEFECCQLQKSVYLTPYICEKEVGEAVSMLGIGRYVHIFLVEHLGNRSGELKRLFR